VERLAGDMRDGVRWFVELAERFEKSDDRTRRIEEAMMSGLVERAREHGVKLEDETLREVFAGDVVLNTQGIEFWLDHGRR
jgi:hypothetical protein